MIMDKEIEIKKEKSSRDKCKYLGTRKLQLKEERPREASGRKEKRAK